MQVKAEDLLNTEVMWIMATPKVVMVAAGANVVADTEVDIEVEEDIDKLKVVRQRKRTLW